MLFSSQMQFSCWKLHCCPHVQTVSSYNDPPAFMEKVNLYAFVLYRQQVVFSISNVYELKSMCFTLYSVSGCCLTLRIVYFNTSSLNKLRGQRSWGGPLANRGLPLFGTRLDTTHTWMEGLGRQAAPLLAQAMFINTV